jgi:hypothetical protein
LLLERFRQLHISGLELLEQPDVLDRDHCLVGEGLRQRDLLVREGFHFTPPHVDDTNWYSLPEERRGQHCPLGNGGAPRAGQRFGEFRLGQREQVLDVNRSAIKDHAPADGSRGYGEGSTDGCGPRYEPMDCNDPKRLALQAEDRGVRRTAESRSTRGDDVHHGLEVGW